MIFKYRLAKIILYHPSIQKDAKIKTSIFILQSQLSVIEGVVDKLYNGIMLTLKVHFGQHVKYISYTFSQGI